MKRKTAREILADSFRELMEHKSADKITIREITTNCGYSMATFYRQFRDKYDLIAWDYARRFREKVALEESESLHDCFFRSAVMYGEQKEYLANLIRHTSGFYSFVENMKNIHFSMIRKFFLSRTGLGELSTKLEMYIRLYCSGTTDITCDWILGKFEASTEDLAEIYENSLPFPLRELLAEK